MDIEQCLCPEERNISELSVERNFKTILSWLDSGIEIPSYYFQEGQANGFYLATSLPDPFVHFHGGVQKSAAHFGTAHTFPTCKMAYE